MLKESIPTASARTASSTALRIAWSPLTGCPEWATVTGTTAKRPNSFIYHYVPQTPGDLHHGKLEALQVLNQAGTPITFESEAALNNPDQIALHTSGVVLKTRWVLVHNTATQGDAPFNA